MKKNLYFYSNLLAWGLVLFLVANYTFGWTTPTQNPPAGNITPSFSQWTTSGSNIYYNTGNVGIGTVSPGTKLHFDTGGVDTTLSIRMRNFVTGDGADQYNQINSGRLSSGNSYLSFGTTHGGTYGEKVRIDNNGNVGIGTTEPGAKLDVSGTVRAKKFEFTGGGNVGQFPEYWRFADVLTLTTDWQTAGENKWIRGSLSDLFPGYSDMEVLFFYVASFDTNPTTIDTQLYYYDGAWKTYALASSTAHSYSRNYRCAGSILFSNFPGISWVKFQAKLTEGSSKLEDVFVVFRPIY